MTESTIEFKTGIAYTAHHGPTDEDWLILGVNEERNKVCAAGWPPTIAKLSDCTNFEENRPLTDDEKAYRNKNFGSNWI